MSSDDQGPRRALVTGSSAGIGRSISEVLIDAGWRVHGIDQSASTLEARGYTHQLCDLCALRPDELPPLGELGFDALIHSAGMMYAAPLGALDPLAGERLWRIHVQALETLANVLLPSMSARRWGRLVVIGSRVSAGLPKRSQYAATKSALLGLTRSWASELAPSGVTVNVVSPAATRTALLADPARSVSAPRVPPMGRLIEPSEIAALVAFLLSDKASAITGQDIAICGGASLPA